MQPSDPRYRPGTPPGTVHTAPISPEGRRARTGIIRTTIQCPRSIPTRPSGDVKEGLSAARQTAFTR